MAFTPEQQCALTIDRTRLLPRRCSQALPAMLGFESRRDCLEAIERQSPFHGFTLEQIARLEGQGTRKHISVVDRSLEVVGVLTQVKRNSNADEITAYIAPISSRPSSVGFIELAELSIWIADDRLEWRCSEQHLGRLPERYTSLMQRILPEDRDWLEDCLQRANVDQISECFFRLPNQAGEIVEAYYQFRPETDARRFHGQLTLFKSDSLRRFSLHSLNGLPGVDIQSRDIIKLPPWFYLPRFIMRLQQLMQQSWRSQELTINLALDRDSQLDQQADHCSICGDEINVKSTSVIAPIQIHFDQAQCSAWELHRLLEPGSPRFRPSPPALLPLLEEAHRQGMHASLSLSGEQYLQLKLAAST